MQKSVSNAMPCTSQHLSLLAAHLAALGVMLMKPLFVIGQAIATPPVLLTSPHLPAFGSYCRGAFVKGHAIKSSTARSTSREALNARTATVAFGLQIERTVVSIVRTKLHCASSDQVSAEKQPLPFDSVSAAKLRVTRG
jgi:hypothetical protein